MQSHSMLIFSNSVVKADNFWSYDETYYEIMSTWIGKNFSHRIEYSKNKKFLGKN